MNFLKAGAVLKLYFFLTTLFFVSQTSHGSVDYLSSERSMLAYFDLAVESPNEKKYIYFQFAKGAGYSKKSYPGKVVVKYKETGLEVSVAVTNGHTHYGARQMWLTDNVIAYQDVKDGVSFVHDLEKGYRWKINGHVEMPSQDGKLLLVKKPIILEDRDKPLNEILMLDVSKKTKINKVDFESLVLSSNVCKNHQAYCKKFGTLKHPKFSPDGKKVFFVFLAHEKGGEKLKSAFTWDYVGNNVNEVGEIGLHPMWLDNKNLFSLVLSSNSNRSRLDVEKTSVTTSSRTILFRELLVDHASFNPYNDEVLVSDVFDYPALGLYSITMYDFKKNKEYILETYKMPSSISKHDRVHGHPVWSRDGQTVFFNCFENGFRKTCLKNVSNLL